MVKHIYRALNLSLLLVLSACAFVGQETPLVPTEILTSVKPSPTLPSTLTVPASLTPQPTATVTLTPTPEASPTATALPPLASARVAKFFQLAWSPSGERIAVTTNKGLSLFDANDLSPVVSADTAQPLTYMAFRPDGRQLVTTGGTNYQIWDAVTGQLIQDQFFTINGIPGLGYDQAGNLYIALLGGSGTDIVVAKLKGQKSIGMADISYAPTPLIAISPAGDTVAVPSGGIEIWDMNYRQEPLRMVGKDVLRFNYNPFEFIYSPDGKWIAAGDTSCQIRVFEVATGETVQTITWCEQWPKGHRGLAFSADGKWLAANNGAGALLIWDATTGELLQTIPVAVSQTSGLAFSPDGKRLAAIGDDNTVRLWAVQP